MCTFSKNQDFLFFVVYGFQSYVLSPKSIQIANDIILKVLLLKDHKGWARDNFIQYIGKT